MKASLRAANKDAAASKEMIQALRPHISLTDRLANMEKQQPPTFKGASGNPCVEEQQRGESPHLEEKRMARGARGNVRRKGSQVCTLATPHHPKVPCLVCKPRLGVQHTVGKHCGDSGFPVTPESS